MSINNFIDVDLRLKCPFTMLVSGPSSSGKSSFVKELLLRRKVLFNSKPGKVFWFYKVHQDWYEATQRRGVVSEFIQGMCTTDWIKDNITDDNSTIVIDDMALEATEDTAQLFTVASHHYNVNIIFICQNLFTKNKYFRDISINSTYIVIFKNPRDKSVITNFAKQFMPGNTKPFLKAYMEATKKPHSYLLIYFYQKTNEHHRIISNYLSENNDYPIIYKID